MVNGSSAADSPAAGIATSPPPKAIVVSALDPDAMVDMTARCQSCCVGRAYR